MHDRCWMNCGHIEPIDITPVPCLTYTSLMHGPVPPLQVGTERCPAAACCV
jgi:hypothetical protein